MTASRAVSHDLFALKPDRWGTDIKVSEDSAVAFKKEKPDQRQDCHTFPQTGARDAVSIFTYTHKHRCCA